MYMYGVCMYMCGGEYVRCRVVYTCVSTYVSCMLECVNVCTYVCKWDCTCVESGRNEGKGRNEKVFLK